MNYYYCAKELLASEIKASWNGKRPLKVVFWYYKMLFGTVLFHVCARSEEYIPSLFSGMMAFYFVYSVWAIKSVWACAGNSSHPIFDFLAKLMMLIHALLTIFIFMFFVESRMDHRPFREVVRDSRLIEAPPQYKERWKREAEESEGKRLDD